MLKLCAFADEYGNSFLEQVEGLKSNEINLIELRGIDGKNVAELTIEEANVYYEKFKAEGISVWSIGSPLGKVDIAVDMDEYMKKVRHVCALANALHTDKIRIFSFLNAHTQREKVMITLRRMVGIAKEYGVFLYHENEKDIYGDTLERVVDVQKEIKDLKYVYDPANYLQVGEKAKDTLAALLDKTDYFHVKDVIQETNEIVPAGYGNGRITEILDKVNGDFTFTLEPHLAVFNGYADIDGTEMKTKFKFDTNKEAFNFAVQSMKKLLAENGYKKNNNGYER